MSYREVDLIRDRSLRMLRSAKESLDNGNYDIAAFMADQAVQLFLKSVILELSGEMPRVHVVRQLMYIIRELTGKHELIDEFIRENRSLFIRLEEAYISSRYMPRVYERDESEELIKFAEEVIELVKSIKGKA